MHFVYFSLFSAFGLFCILSVASGAPSLQCSQDIAAYIAGITPLNPKLWALKSKLKKSLNICSFRNFLFLAFSLKLIKSGIFQIFI